MRTEKEIQDRLEGKFALIENTRELQKNTKQGDSAFDAFETIIRDTVMAAVELQWMLSSLKVPKE